MFFSVYYFFKVAPAFVAPAMIKYQDFLPISKCLKAKLQQADDWWNKDIFSNETAVSWAITQLFGFENTC